MILQDNVSLLVSSVISRRHLDQSFPEWHAKDMSLSNLVISKPHPRPTVPNIPIISSLLRASSPVHYNFKLMTFRTLPSHIIGALIKYVLISMRGIYHSIGCSVVCSFPGQSCAHPHFLEIGRVHTKVAPKVRGLQHLDAQIHLNPTNYLRCIVLCKM